jgi:hypothetical protein
VQAVMLCLGMTPKMPFDAFREQALAPALTPAGERGATPFGFHAGTKTVLLFARAFGWLVSAFHKTAKSFRRDSRAVTVGMSAALSISRVQQGLTTNPATAGRMHTNNER